MILIEIYIRIFIILKAKQMISFSLMTTLRKTQHEIENIISTFILFRPN